MKLLIVGLGSMGLYHIKKFINLGVEIVGGVDPDTERQNKAQELYNIPWVGEKIEDFKGAVDAISIAVPDSLHKQCYLKAVKLNKPLFLEKPLAVNLEEALEIKDKVGSAAIVNYSKRNVIALFALKQILENKTLGKIEKVDIQYNQSWLTKEAAIPWMENERYLWRISPLFSAGGCVADLGSHLLDCLFILFNKVKLIKQIDATTFKNLFDKGYVNYKSSKEEQFKLLEDIKGKPKMYVDYKGEFLIDETIPCFFSCTFLSQKYSEAMIIKIMGSKGEAFIDSSLDRKNVTIKMGDKYEKIKGSPITPTYTNFKNFVEQKPTNNLPTINRAVEIQQILQEILFCQ